MNRGFALLALTFGIVAGVLTVEVRDASQHPTPIVVGTAAGDPVDFGRALYLPLSRAWLDNRGIGEDSDPLWSPWILPPPMPDHIPSWLIVTPMRPLFDHPEMVWEDRDPIGYIAEGGSVLDWIDGPDCCIGIERIP